MKKYEAEWTFTLPAHGYKILRLDGHGFYRWTKKHCKKPFDTKFMDVMNWTAQELCKEIQGVCFAYVQSDEISVLITDLGAKEQQWFGGDVVKTVSVSASIASNEFNNWFDAVNKDGDTAQFDARVFAVPDRLAVERYFLWRQGDAYTNAVSMLASSHFSPKQLHGKTTSDRVAMLAASAVPFPEDQGVFFGRLVVPQNQLESVTYTHKKTGEEITDEVWRTRWVIEKAQWFDWDATGLLNILIP